MVTQNAVIGVANVSRWHDVDARVRIEAYGTKYILLSNKPNNHRIRVIADSFILQCPQVGAAEETAAQLERPGGYGRGFICYFQLTSNSENKERIVRCSYRESFVYASKEQ